MYMPQRPESIMRLSVGPHPNTREPAACFHVHLEDGHVFDLWLDHDEFESMVEDMNEALGDLQCLIADWVIVDCPSVPGNHLMEIEAFANRKRRALCGVHPRKGEKWEGLPLMGSPRESDEMCERCVARWSAEGPNDPTMGEPKERGGVL